MSGDLFDHFTQISSALESECQLREILRAKRNDLETALRRLDAVVGRLHTQRDAASLIEQAQSLLSPVVDSFMQLQASIPDGAFYKYNDLWRHCTVHLVQHCVVIHFMQTGGVGPRSTSETAPVSDNEVTGQLATLDNVRMMLFGKAADKDPLPRFETDEYLLGVCAAVQEMSRLAANRVVLGDYQTPRNMARFANDVHAGMRLLSFRNDALRRSFDALKYAAQRLDGVVYDLSIRNLS